MLHHFIENRTLSYIVGLLQSDGHYQTSSRNRGKVRLELQAKDRHILDKLQDVFPTYSSVKPRVRDTNFKKDYESVVWTLSDWEARNSLEELGVPAGRKSESVGLPTFDYSVPDYFRGLVDGDGSLGYTAKGFPFLSLVTKSTILARAYEEFLQNVTGKPKRTNPNTRDQVFNICVYKEDAQAVANCLYGGSEISLERKYQAHLDVMKWLRPASMKKIGRRRWTSKEDECVLAHTVEEAATALGRTTTSIRVRKSRLITSVKCGLITSCPSSIE